MVTGSHGQLGRCLVRSLTDEASAGGDVLARAFARSELDIGDPDAISSALDALDGGPPDVLVNAAAYNQVDRCESDGWSEAERFTSSADPQTYLKNKEQAVLRLSSELASRIHDELFVAF